MTAPLPIDDASSPLELRILPVPDTEPPADAEPYWAAGRPRLVREPELPLVRPHAAPAPSAATPAGVPGAELAARRFVRAYLDVLSGRRRVDQLAALSTEDCLVQLREDLTGQRHSVRVQRIRHTEPAPGVAECVAVIEDSDRNWALAFRLEHQGGWRCVHLERIR